MALLTDAFGFLWGALILGLWIYLTIEFIRAAVNGKFWFWRRNANGKAWPPRRSESPVRFWLVWVAMAGPFLFATTFTLMGFGLSILQR